MPKREPMVNTYFKEHFWPFEFVKSLNKSIMEERKSNIKMPGGSRTYEDLQLMSASRKSSIKPMAVNKYV